MESGWKKMNDNYIYKHENITLSVLGVLNREDSNAYMAYGIYNKKAFADAVNREYGTELTEKDVEHKNVEVTDDGKGGKQLVVYDRPTTDGVPVTIAEIE